MLMSSQLHHHGEVTIEYGLLGPVGEDRKVALAFHGFSRPFDDMAAVQPLAGDRAVLALHLAAHGKSSGHHRPLDPNDWISAINALLASEELVFDGVLIGYSLGGRIALSWWAREPERFSRVVLMAPDGLDFRTARGHHGCGGHFQCRHLLRQWSRGIGMAQRIPVCY